MAEWPVAAPVTTSRLLLEPLRPDHARVMAAVLADPPLYRFTGGEPPGEAELRSRYERMAVGHSPDGTQGWCNWIVLLRDDGRAIGTVQATVTREGPDLVADLAWVIGTGRQGRGYAAEAAAGMAAWLAGAGVTSFGAWIHPDHAASAGVARRLGLTPSAELADGEVHWT
jgi:RimJ/RimL family protein N-acetyltransferase